MPADDNNNQDNKKFYLGYGIGFGLLGGAFIAVIVGIIFSTPLVWAFAPGVGMLVGMVIGIAMDAHKNKQ